MNKILVVEDDADILDTVMLILQMHHFEVVGLSDCRNAIQVANDTAPDLILLDINLGYCDGRHLCLNLKDIHLFKNHILLFSANPELVPSLTLYKADDFIQKPFNMNFFLKTIRHHMPVN